MITFDCYEAIKDGDRYHLTHSADLSPVCGATASEHWSFDVARTEVLPICPACVTALVDGATILWMARAGVDARYGTDWGGAIPWRMQVLIEQPSQADLLERHRGSV